jgi:molecular chaperone GrpE
MAMADNDKLHGAHDSGRPRPAAQTEPQADVGAQVAEPADELAQLRTQLAEARDKLLRAQAELENYRKRARRELEDERRYAEIHLIRDLLPIVDNVSRAIAAAEKKADAAALLEGLKMMSQQFERIFSQHNSKLITDEAVGAPFDPHRHEAILQQPSEEHPEHTVLGVTRPGLELHDRIVRPAQVIVSKRGQGPEARG